MTSSGYRTASNGIDDLQAQLDELSIELQGAPREERPAILRRMWELSGRIAEARYHSTSR